MLTRDNIEGETGSDALLERVAVHEAAHAVVAHAHGCRITSISIVPDGDLLGTCTPGAPWARGTAIHRARLAIALAGEVGEVVTFGGDGLELLYDMVSSTIRRIVLSRILAAQDDVPTPSASNEMTDDDGPIKDRMHEPSYRMPVEKPDDCTDCDRDEDGDMDQVTSRLYLSPPPDVVEAAFEALDAARGDFGDALAVVSNRVTDVELLLRDRAHVVQSLAGVLRSVKMLSGATAERLIAASFAQGRGPMMNKRTGILHDPVCRWASRISMENRVHMSATNAGAQSGRACRNCHSKPRGPSVASGRGDPMAISNPPTSARHLTDAGRTNPVPQRADTEASTESRVQKGART